MTINIKPVGGSAVAATSEQITTIKTDLALHLVNNTADADKPVSTAQAAADAAVAATAAAATATAQGTANTAVTNAATAQAAADAAQITANTGVTNAAAAQATANTGVTNAATAQAAADAAQAAADAAQATANAAEPASTFTGYGRTLVGLSSQIEVKASLGVLDATNPTIAGVATHPGSWIVVPVALAALAINPADAIGSKTIAADSEFTFSATPTSGQEFALQITNSDSSPHIVTFPSSVPDGQSTAVTTVTVPASSTITLAWKRDGATNRLYGAAGIGTHMVPIMAAGMAPSTTSGCAELATVSMGADMPDVRVLYFDATAKEHAEFAIAMPESWDEGPVQFEFLSMQGSAGAGAVRWGAQGVAAGNDDTMAAAFGTAQEATRTMGTVNDVYRSARTSNITIAGTPQAGDTVFFRVYRDPVNAGDTLGVDAGIVGVRLYYSSNADTDA